MHYECEVYFLMVGFQIFSPLLQHLYRIMQNASFVGSTHCKPIEILHELTSLAFYTTKNNFPICSLMVKLVSIKFIILMLLNLTIFFF